MARTVTSGRDGRRRESILHAIRERIVRGEWRPGSQLPSHSQLRESFNASPVTVQAALDDLAAEGFVLAESRRGTFVAERPPHLSRYGLVFPWRPSTEGNQHFRSRFFTALQSEAARVAREEGAAVRTFYDSEGHGVTQDYRSLVNTVLRHGVAGLIFATPPFRLHGTPVLDDPSVPRVVLMESGEYVGMTTVRMDRTAFFDKALTHLASRGRRRVAVVTVSSMDPLNVLRHAPAAKVKGLEIRPSWVHGVHAGSTKWARHIVELLMSAPEHDRPDALIVADDNLAEDATAGVAAAGLSAADPASPTPGGADVDVVVHCNHPWPPPTMVPVARLGFDVRRVLRTAIDAIDAARAGQAPQGRVVPVAPQFEWELESDRPASVTDAPPNLT